jgi:hypothetical protein
MSPAPPAPAAPPPPALEPQPLPAPPEPQPEPATTAKYVEPKDSPFPSYRLSQSNAALQPSGAGQETNKAHTGRPRVKETGLFGAQGLRFRGGR